MTRTFRSQGVDDILHVSHNGFRFGHLGKPREQYTSEPLLPVQTQWVKYSPIPNGLKVIGGNPRSTVSGEIHYSRERNESYRSERSSVSVAIIIIRRDYFDSQSLGNEVGLEFVQATDIRKLKHKTRYN